MLGPQVRSVRSGCTDRATSQGCRIPPRSGLGHVAAVNEWRTAPSTNLLGWLPVADGRQANFTQKVDAGHIGHFDVRNNQIEFGTFDLGEAFFGA